MAAQKPKPFVPPKKPEPEIKRDESKEPEPESDDGDAETPAAFAAPPPVPNEFVEPDSGDLGNPGSTDQAPVVDEAPKKRTIKDRVRDAEERWEKDFDEIILDIHDHIFGTSPPHEETVAKRKAEADIKAEAEKAKVEG